MNDALPIIISYLLSDGSGTGSDPSLNVSPTVVIESPVADSNIVANETLIVEAQASDSDGQIASVTLLVDDVVVGVDTARPFRWGAEHTSLQTLNEGQHALTAVATDNQGGTAEYSININVVAANSIRKLSRTNWSATANRRPADVALAIDGDATTRWTTGQVQQNGQEFSINLGAVETFDRLVLDVTQSPNDYPRQYAVEVSTDGSSWTNIANGVGADADQTVIDFPDQTASHIRIRQLGSSASFWWSIHELNLFANASGAVNPPVGTGDCVVSNDNRRWHRVELLCDGPFGDEADDRTFTDHRFDVTFSQNGTSIRVPGHFAADGDAAESGATTGNKWRAYFAPPTTGNWDYTVSFRRGSNLAIGNNAGASVEGIDGATGQFNVNESNTSGPDLRGRGLLQHRNGERYLRFAGDDSVFIQGGMDSPENIFGYSGFDNTDKRSGGSCKGILHDFTPHQADWRPGDPSWNGGQGTELIGLINYIASRGVNSIYIMMNTVNGDGCDAHPWSSYNSNGQVKSFDVSKLDQWEIALEHMTRSGIMIHAMTQETENDQLLNGGDLGLERKLYYRELISRFGHHPALQWNLGEENTNTTAQRKAYSDYFKNVDPYDHPIKMHTFPGQQSQYDGLLGHATFDGATIQVSGISTNTSLSGNGAYGLANKWITDSTNAGRPWVVTFTEASGGNAPTPYDSVSPRQRIHWMWGSVMSGGGGFEWYLKNNGAGHAYDLAVEDLREFDQYWQQSGYLVRFFRDILQGEYGIDPQELSPANNLTSSTTDWVLSKPDEAYLIYVREGGTNSLSLPNKRFKSVWFNPRSGVASTGPNLIGPGDKSIPNPPSEVASDWVLLVVADESVSNPAMFTEQNGLVVMEAESTNSDLGLWIKETDVSGFTGDDYLEFTGNTPLNGPARSPLAYTFTVSQAGLYYLHMRVARETVVLNGETRTDVANDGFVRVDGDYNAGPNVGNSHGDDAPLVNLTANTKFFGGNDNQFAWASGNRLDLGGHNNKRVAVYDFKAGETYTFVLHGRSQLFKVDRIVFRHQDVPVSTAQSLSQAETR